MPVGTGRTQLSHVGDELTRCEKDVGIMAIDNVDDMLPVMNRRLTTCVTSLLNITNELTELAVEAKKQKVRFRTTPGWLRLSFTAVAVETLHASDHYLAHWWLPTPKPDRSSLWPDTVTPARLSKLRTLRLLDCWPRLCRRSRRRQL
jgi:hypothetical protein